MLSFEKCIYHQLYKSFDVLLVSRQSALRKHHGCDTALKVKFNRPTGKYGLDSGLDFRLDSGLDPGLDFIKRS